MHDPCVVGTRDSPIRVGGSRYQVADSGDCRGAAPKARLRGRFGNHPHVGDIRGRGVFWALELVEDRASKRSFESKCRINTRLELQGLENGLMCYPIGGSFDGVTGDRALLAPPYIISEAQLDEVVDKLTYSLDQVVAG